MLGCSAIRQAAQEEAREQDQRRRKRERRGAGIAVLRQLQDQEAGDDGVVDVDESHGNAGGNERSPQPTSAGEREPMAR